MNRSNLILKSFVVLAIFSLFAVTGCKKDNTTTKDYEAATDNAEGDIMSNDILTVADQAINNQGVSKNAEGKWHCATITKEKINNDYYKIVLDFGDVNTSCFNNVPRRGKIIITFKGHYFMDGFSDTITFDNFYLNDRHIEGKHIVSNIGNLTWKIQAIDMKITRPDNKFHSWNSVRERQLIVDTTGGAWNTFVYKITGNASGVNIKGLAYTADITKPLIKALDCWWIESGTIEFNVDGKPTVTLDYGDGKCDKKATVSVDGKTYDINL